MSRGFTLLEFKLFGTGIMELVRKRNASEAKRRNRMKKRTRQNHSVPASKQSDGIYEKNPSR